MKSVQPSSRFATRHFGRWAFAATVAASMSAACGRASAQDAAWDAPIVYYVRPPVSRVHISPAWLETLQESWQSYTRVACASINVRFAGTTQTAPDVSSQGADGRSVIGFEEQNWPYGSSVTAVTKVREIAGKVVEADMLLNAVDFEWRIRPVAADSMRLRELKHTLPHELGHFLGLGHADDKGSIMYPDARRSTLSGEDERALCALYPRRAKPVQTKATTWLPFAGLLLLALVGVACALPALVRTGKHRAKRPKDEHVG